VAKPHIIVAGAATVGYTYVGHFSKEGSSSRITFVLSRWLCDKVVNPILIKNRREFSVITRSSKISGVFYYSCVMYSTCFLATMPLDKH